MAEVLAQADDSTNENECKMHLGVIYASAQGRALYEIFHPAQWDTKSLAEPPSVEVRLANCAVCSEKGGSTTRCYI